MSARNEYDAVVVGAGPNGLAAAAVIARAGRSVLVVEAADTIGGGTRSAELTLPGFVHDVCSAIHPIGYASPVFRELGVTDMVEWVQPDLAGRAPAPRRPRRGPRTIHRRDRRRSRGRRDAYRRLFEPLVDAGEKMPEALMSPLDIPPRHPVVLARYGAGGDPAA